MRFLSILRWSGFEIEAQQLSRFFSEILPLFPLPRRQPSRLTERQPGRAALRRFEMRGGERNEQAWFRLFGHVFAIFLNRADQSRDADLVVFKLYLLEIFARRNIFAEKFAAQRVRVSGRFGLEFDAKKIAGRVARDFLLHESL